MNKYTDFIQESLESEHGLSNLFSKLRGKFYLTFPADTIRNYDELLRDNEHKLSYIYLLSIVDQETADEMIELLKEPV